MEAIKFEFGAFDEGKPWAIVFNQGVSAIYGTQACKHCAHVSGVEYICPRVVSAVNEGGYNGTSVCLDCILEAAATLPAPLTVGG